MIIPVINCPDFDCVKKKLGILAEMFPDGKERWVHLDVADGGFTDGYTTWRNPGDLSTIKSNFKIEAHLMVQNPEAILEFWLAAGVSRMVIHLESTENLPAIIDECRKRGVEVMLALSPNTPVEHAAQYLSSVDACQLLAVTPGKAGQPFQELTLSKIKEVRQKFPDLDIEIDGGITPQTAKECTDAGATYLAAGSYIFGSEHPLDAYRQLEQV